MHSGYRLPMIPLPRLTPDLASLSTALDAAAPAARVNWSRGLSGSQLMALWELAEASPAPLSVSDLVPGDDVIVRHVGKNSLPVFCNFEKHLVRRQDGDIERVQGFNDNAAWLMRLTGPGHFTVTQESEEVVLFDYTVLAGSVPEGFPPLGPNEGGLRGPVFGGMHDRVRRVSAHVTIGRAWKHGKATQNTFLLVRQDEDG